MRCRVGVLVIASVAGCHRVQPGRVEIDVTAEWPGASAQVMASRVAAPLEREVGRLGHLTTLTSVSRDGTTVIRAVFDGDPKPPWMSVQEAVGRTSAALPRDLPAPPHVFQPAPVIGRYLVARDAANGEMEAVSRHLEVTAETCGTRKGQQELLLDPRALANMGITVHDVVGAIHIHRGVVTPSLEIVRRNGVVVRLSDVGTLRDADAPPDCALATPVRGQVELIVHQAPPLRPFDVRGTLVPATPELHGELDPALEPGAAADRIAQAIGSDAAIAEIRGNALVVRGATATVEHRLRQTPGVLQIGERTATVHVSGADARQVAEAARAIGERLRAAGQLVATHGLATAVTRPLDIDRDRAAQLGVSPEALADTLGAMHGLVVTTMFTHADSVPLVLRVAGADSMDQLFVRANGDRTVPLSSLVRATEVSAPLEVLHRAQLPDVDLEVHGDPRAAIGAVPAGVHVDVDVD